MAHENATPRPWAVHCRLGEDAGTLVYHHPAFADDRHVCDCSFGSSIGAEENAANAALIVEAVNAYDTLRAENERLAAFARKIIGISAFEGSDLDGGEVQSIAEKSGLIVACKYDPSRHGPSDYAEPGDDFYEFAPILCGPALSEAQP